MEVGNNLTIYEYFSPEGDPDSYICTGHVDSTTFREAVHQKFSVKPKVVQHRWRRSKRIVKRDLEEKKFRGYTTDIACLSEEPGAFAITVGTL